MPPRIIDPAKAVALRDQGWTYQQIGDKFGVTANSARLAVVREQSKQKEGAKEARRKGKSVRKAKTPGEDRTRLQIMFGRQDRDRIDELRLHCGISRAADIVRLAINTLASDIRKGRGPDELPEAAREALTGQTTFRMDENDRKAISLIQEHYGLRSAAEVIRLSLTRLYQILM